MKEKIGGNSGRENLGENLKLEYVPSNGVILMGSEVHNGGVFGVNWGVKGG